MYFENVDDEKTRQSILIDKTLLTIDLKLPWLWYINTFRIIQSFF